MRINSIKIKNRLDSLEEKVFNSNMTVIQQSGNHLTGSMAQAICAGLWPFVDAFDLAIHKEKDPLLRLARINSLKHDEVLSIELTGSFCDSPIKKWSRTLAFEEKPKIKNAGAVRSLINWANWLQQKSRCPEQHPQTLPVIANFSFEEEIPKIHQDNTRLTCFYSRTFGYRECLSSVNSKVLALEWFNWFFLCYREYQITAMEGRPVAERHKYTEVLLYVIQAAVDALVTPLTGWGKLAYSESHNRSIVLEHAEHGVEKIENIDCDVRNLVLLIIGIVHRCIKLNPHMGLLALVQSPGIVVIDGSRLPNQWHSHVVAELVVVFPAIQFILVCGARSLDH